MHSLFLPIAAPLNSWTAHRLFSACRSFSAAIDTEYDAQAVYEDHQKVGYVFRLSSLEQRDRLATFFDRLVEQVLADSRYGDPVIQGQYDASAALQQG